MTLETVLSNLTDYVDLGIARFTPVKKGYDNNMVWEEYITYGVDRMMDNFDFDDIMTYINYKYSVSDVMDHLDESDVSDWCARNDFGDSILESMSTSEIRDFLRDNLDPEDVCTVEWKSW